jgi:hypothetical protein
MEANSRPVTSGRDYGRIADDRPTEESCCGCTMPYDGLGMGRKAVSELLHPDQ